MKISIYIATTIAVFLSGCTPVVNLSSCSLPSEDSWIEVTSNSAQLSKFFLNSKIKRKQNAVWFINNTHSKVYACGLAIGSSPDCGSHNSMYIKNKGVVSEELQEIVICSSSPY
jgi:hypothetical protein